MNRPLSGNRYDLAAGEYSASIASVGASIRSLRYQERDLVVPFDEDEVRPGFRGATLAPWPNRVIDGLYTFEGTVEQLGLSEPARRHALHGLAAWLDFEAIAQTAESVTLRAIVEAQAGYPHRVEVTETFELGEGGLTATVTGRNLSASRAPWGTGPHPYLVAGHGRVDDWTLTLPASTVLTVSEDRLIPIGLEDVGLSAGGSFDFRNSRQIGDVFIDHAFTGLARDPELVASVTVTEPDGHGVIISWGPECPWVQVHTADQPDPALSRLGLAVEPMTCPPGAFNSGVDLIVLEVGESSSASWTIGAL